MSVIDKLTLSLIARQVDNSTLSLLSQAGLASELTSLLQGGGNHFWCQRTQALLNFDIDCSQIGDWKWTYEIVNEAIKLKEWVSTVDADSKYNLQAAQILLRLGYKSQQQVHILEGVKYAPVEFVEQLLEQLGVGPFALDDKPLRAAAHVGRVDVLKHLLTYTDTVPKQTVIEMIVLAARIAAYADQLEALKFLILELPSPLGDNSIGMFYKGSVAAASVSVLDYLIETYPAWFNANSAQLLSDTVLSDLAINVLLDRGVIPDEQHLDAILDELRYQIGGLSESTIVRLIVPVLPRMSETTMDDILIDAVSNGMVNLAIVLLDRGAGAGIGTLEEAAKHSELVHAMLRNGTISSYNINIVLNASRMSLSTFSSAELAQIVSLLGDRMEEELAGAALLSNMPREQIVSILSTS
ncbi:Hypothetical protein POVR2_LOCUS312 [uncultured virus]|nr:Hypothetical protein POVR2_LOCUS312 [uncultured virus]